jgi:hypothetical protein
MDTQRCDEMKNPWRHARGSFLKRVRGPELAIIPMDSLHLRITNPVRCEDTDEPEGGMVPVVSSENISKLGLGFNAPQPVFQPLRTATSN